VNLYTIGSVLGYIKLNASCGYGADCVPAFMVLIVFLRLCILWLWFCFLQVPAFFHSDCVFLGFSVIKFMDIWIPNSNPQLHNQGSLNPNQSSVKQIETQTGTNSILRSAYVFLVFISLSGIFLSLFQCYINKALCGTGYHVFFLFLCAAPYQCLQS
jgi:hypothetical protein